ncbi:SdpI family protein [Hymenobacter algoricola]|uniref:SdpI family protein n=1 Tax=Hymenobacter algoricola TaxID=486267 RepID=A0ABP7N1I4_9BACT
MNSKPSLWTMLTIGALLAAPAYLALVWPQLPAQIPTHFDAAGQANGFTAKADIWRLCVALPLGTFVLLTALPYLDPKKRLNSGRVNYQKLRLALVAGMSGLSAYCLYVSLHPGAATQGGLTILLGMLFLGLGNYLTTVQPNYFVVIRTPWTLESPVVWARTNRLGGRLFFLAGLVGVGLGFTTKAELGNTIMVGLVIGAAAAAWAYSYFAYRQEVRAAELT